MIQRNNKSIKHIYKGDMPKLPDAYQEVEYLESSGTQYIDLDVCGSILSMVAGNGF